MRSRTEAGILPQDIIRLAPDRLLVADFGAGWRSPKRSATADPTLRGWLRTWETDDTYRLSIEGYADCVSDGATNSFIRRGRAIRVAGLLGRNARARASSVGMAPLTSYVEDNNSPEHRARNRGAVISFRQEINAEELLVPARLCPTTATAASTFDDYVHLVMCAERALPAYSPRQMLSLLRQLYYSPESWSVCRGRTCQGWPSVIPCGLSISDPTAALGPALIGSLRASKVVGGVDVGHVFAGLEAGVCPRPNVELEIPGPNWIVRMPNDEFASWGGDLGSAAAAKVHDEHDLGRPPQPWTRYFGTAGTLASGEDLRGDIDSFVLRKGLAGESCGRRPAAPVTTISGPMSEVLHQYYVAVPDATGTSEPPTRYRCFVEAIGGRLAGDTIVNGSDLVNAMTPRVFSFAEMSYKLQWHSGYLAPPGIGAWLLGSSRQVSQRFVEWLQDNLSR